MMRLLLGLILCAALWPALAQDGASANTVALFRVELIVFENLDPAALRAEQWPDDPGAPPVDHAMELNDLTAAAAADAAAAAAKMAAAARAPAITPVSAAPPAPNPPDPATAAAGSNPPASGTVVRTAPTVTVSPAAAPPPAPSWRWLTPAELRLNGAEQKLATSGRYHSLLHVGWIQALDTSEHGTPVHIYDGMGTQPINSATEPPAPPGAAAPAPATAPPLAASPHTLDGVITVWRSRFLHADLDLGYRRTYTPAAAPTAALPPPTDGAAAAMPVAPQPVTLAVRMTQSRRLRADEVHYLDHPLFGALVMVSPVQDAPAAAGQ